MCSLVTTRSILNTFFVKHYSTNSDVQATTIWETFKDKLIHNPILVKYILEGNTVKTLESVANTEIYEQLNQFHFGI